MQSQKVPHIYITAQMKWISLRALDMNLETGRNHQGISLQVISHMDTRLICRIHRELPSS